MAIKVKESASWLFLEGEYKDLERLGMSFRYRPAGYAFSPRFQTYRRSGGKRGWDGWAHPLKQRGTRAQLGRGFLRRLEFQAGVLGLALDRALLKRPFENLVDDDIDAPLLAASHTLYPHQRAAVLAWLEAAIGICQITVSGGKTIAFLLFAAMVKKRFPQARFLYLVPTERLVNQVYGEAIALLPAWDISQFGGGKRDSTGRDLVVATYATVGRNLDKLVRDGWLKSFMGLMVDECHHVSGAQLAKVIQATIAFFKVGATDGLGTEPDRLMTAESLLGPVLVEADAAPLIEDGHLAKPHIYVVDVKAWNNQFEHVPLAPPLDSPAWVLTTAGEWLKGEYRGPAVLRDGEGEPVYDKDGQELTETGRHVVATPQGELEISSRWCLLERSYDRAIVRFKARNQLIVDWVTHLAGERELRTLVVCTRTLHVVILETLIATELGAGRVRRLYSAHTTKERDAAFDWFRTSRGGVLVTPLAKEGVSVPEIQAGVVADFVASQSFANQIIGRFIRKKRDGENAAHIVWFKDRQTTSMRRGSTRLINWLRTKEGYDVIEPVTSPQESLLLPVR